MRTELEPGSPLVAYGLELNGARALAGRGACPSSEHNQGNESVRWQKAYTRRTEWFLEHRLLISHFRCVLELAVQATPGLELLEWDQSERMWGHAYVGAPPKKTRIAPDAYFSIRQAKTTRTFYLEMDRGTEEQSRIRSKYVAYWWYLQSTRYTQQRRDHRRVGVLFLTTGDQRRTNMLNTLVKMQKPNRAQHGGKGLFWFACHLDFSLPRPLSIWDRFWHRTAGSGKESLLL